MSSGDIYDVNDPRSVAPLIESVFITYRQGLWVFIPDARVAAIQAVRIEGSE